jgi:hypothetical protein
MELVINSVELDIAANALLIAWWCKIDNESEDPVGGTKFLTSGLDA